MLTYYFVETADHEAYAALDFMLHDFGYRGVSSVESAGIGGLAHLVNFKGTDTLRALEIGRDYYGTSCLAFSVPATEHSIMTACGKDGEVNIVENLFKKFPAGILSIVGDSYNIFNFCENIIGDYCKKDVLNRDGITVIRPDSGNPIEVMLRCLEILEKQFGSTINSKGYKVINPKVKLLWGDGLTVQTIDCICNEMKRKNWSISNVATFGMGGGLLQKINRDTQRFAFKCCEKKRNGKWFPVSKDPIDGSKASKAGNLKLVMKDGEYATVAYENTGIDVMRVVYENGKLLIEETDFEVIRKRAEIK